LLAFDAATSHSCSAAVWHNGAVTVRRVESTSIGQSERLMPLIEEAMAEARLRYQDLEAVAVTLGPGSFTGIRVGLATAQGLALAAGLPVIGITNFIAVAAAVPMAERLGRSLVVLLESKRSDLYVQCFTEHLEPLGPAAAILPEMLAKQVPRTPLLLVGDAVARALPALGGRERGIIVSSASGIPNGAVVATAAARMALRKTNTRFPRPLYLHAPSAKRSTS
jgi:tRNA threonylcarbamoyladenosine biosynthesis protein TsaB